MLRTQCENAISVEESRKMKPEELEDKIVTGVFVNKDIPEFCEEYDLLVERAQKK
jgi:2-oxoglutarate ferredoxin oxidoreductase subunit beta